MPVQVNWLSWRDFDLAVAVIAGATGDQGLRGVCGIPRGGLPLAVALSHRLDLPLVDAPAPGVLLLDDIHDSGRTLAHWARPGVVPWVWVTRERKPAGYHAVLTDAGPDWFVFPWEDPGRAAEDRLAYLGSRA